MAQSRSRVRRDLFPSGMLAAGIADVTRPDVIQGILEHVARQQAPPEFSAMSTVATVH